MSAVARVTAAYAPVGVTGRSEERIGLCLAVGAMAVADVAESDR
jgi:hypothetical protein